MTRGIFIFMLSLFGMLHTAQAQVASVTGQQCRTHLQPLTQLAQRQNIAIYYAVNDEITNIYGRTLQDISQQTVQTLSARRFVQIVRTALSQCAQNCEGLRQQNGETMSCSSIAAMRLSNVGNLMNLIDDNSSAQAEFTPNPECAFDPNAEGCQVAQAPTEVAPTTPSAETPATPTKPRPTAVATTTPTATQTPVATENSQDSDRRDTSVYRETNGNYFRYWVRPTATY